MTPSEQYKGRILIVEDSEALLEMLEFVLKIHNYEVFVKNHAADIYEFVVKTNIDLLLLDVSLHDLSGRDICKKLKANPDTAYFPVILMSATPALLTDFGECNADDIIEKPFGLNVLLSKIKDVMNIGR